MIASQPAATENYICAKFRQPVYAAFAGVMSFATLFDDKEYAEDHSE